MTSQEQGPKIEHLPLAEWSMRAIKDSSITAKKNNHQKIDPEDILLNLIKYGALADDLRQRGISQNQFIATLESAIIPGKEPVTEPVVELSSRSKRVIAFAEAEALVFGQREIEIPDLLLGILQEGQGTGASDKVSARMLEQLRYGL